MSNFRESDILRELLRIPRAAPQVIEGVNEQDDAAVLGVPCGRDLCVTTDFVRGTGFTLHQAGHLSMRDIGRYLVAANVSDLAAMGATPLGFLSVVRYAKERTYEEVLQILQGIDEACRDFGCPLVGGDSGSYQADVLSGTAIGTLPSGRRLSRHTVQSGDFLFVSGEIGGAAAALATATADIDATRSAAFERALQRWRSPQPRVALGEALVMLPHRVSCMDISDGLAASFQQLARIASLGFEVRLDQLPIAPEVTDLSAGLHIDPIHLACSASVDFELLVTCGPDAVASVLGAAQLTETRLTEIGRCIAGTAITARREFGGEVIPLPGVPWDHQSTDMRSLFHAKG